MFHVDRRADMTKLIVAFHNFVNARKNSKKACYKTLTEIINTY